MIVECLVPVLANPAGENGFHSIDNVRQFITGFTQQQFVADATAAIPNLVIKIAKFHEVPFPVVHVKSQRPHDASIKIECLPRNPLIKEKSMNGTPAVVHQENAFFDNGHCLETNFSHHEYRKVRGGSRDLLLLAILFPSRCAIRLLN
jgi:hypothetical protein